MTSTYPVGTHGSVASLLAAIFYLGNRDRSQKLWSIESNEIYILHICRLCWIIATYKWKMGKLK
jgi:hypothetical protein